jgi:predicted nucleotidyltransferase
VDGLTDERIVRELRSACVRRLPDATVQAVYLFGSAAVAALRPESDLDIALLLELPIDDRMAHELAQDLACALGREVDLIDLRRASTVLATQVVGSGRRIETGDAGAAARFEYQTLAEYASLNERRGAAIKTFRERIPGESA